MILNDVTLRRSVNGSQRLAAVVTFETPVPRSFQAYFQVEGAPGDISASADPFVIEFLIPAMMLGEPLRIEASVDPELMETIHENIKPLLLRWFPFLNDIPLHPRTLQSPPARTASPVGAMTFSGGLDSAYTAVKNRTDLNWLVITQGLDVRSYQDEFWQKVYPGLRAVAEAVGLPVVYVRTNIREISHYQAIRTRRGRIDPDYYAAGHMGPLGSYLTAIGRVLDPFCSRFYLSAGVAYENLTPYGSHPLLDPMWSTSRQRVFHDGCEADRIDKVAYLQEHNPEALGRIHVCWLALTTDVNCSRCEKCLRTMTEIRTCGAESIASSFRWPLDLDLIRSMPIRARTREYWVRLLARAEARGDAELAASIRPALHRESGIGRAWRTLRGPKPAHLRARESWKQVRRIFHPSLEQSGEIPPPSEVLSVPAAPTFVLPEPLPPFRSRG